MADIKCCHTEVNRAQTFRNTVSFPPPFLQCFADPTHVLRNYLDEKGLISIRVSGGENSTDSGFYKVHPAIKKYKNGVAQPGVLCVKPDSSVLYAWAIDPAFVSQ